ncbi:MFS transporter [Methermicoccus shengliensis]|uniref:MFS transporter n=1 Tax=Methermicoccus shengliensis TaxID=660064 RepID=A0A832VY34_9EURY|nr:MFS transporter [Methermicoccus shengliensis]KUK04280.1 MAG: Major facilitator superfamily MFS_1 [Euryarchaeota archaeon 55_53]KUK30069.1 MAG: Major facilitator superfamily MFS_1 [Methanosarcinales archeaon 56_1174]MDI3487516.1 transporter, family, multidrug resistance protein [Methanosarcinales archaeon]MDN5295156.1 transporter, family, multidrug resistance protein [Methanosarcinales archaeon]HIH70427.1 MFS transporter [Methermicoccus shengliensis]
MQHSTRLYLDTNLQIIFAITLMAVLGVSSITPALPRIAKALAVSYGEIALLITCFTLPGVVLTPVLGVLADRYGRKTVLMPSLLLFGIAGGMCALSQSFAQLVALRLMQGVGAAALGSLNVTIIGDLYEGRERLKAMGYNASVLSMGTGSYPAIGGLLAMFGWRYPFMLSLIGVPVGIAAMLWLKSPEPRSTEALGDYLRGVRESMSAEVLGLFVVSVATFIILYGAYLTFFPMLLAHTFHLTPMMIGALMSSMSFTTALTSSQVGRLASGRSQRALVLIAFLLYALSLTLIPLVPSPWLMLIPTLLLGVGQGLNIPSVQTLLAELAPIEYRAAFMSVNGMVLRLGQTLGPVLTGMVAAAWGIRAPFYACSLLALGMALLIAMVMNGRA